MTSSTFPILGNLPPLAHEAFAAHRELEARLKRDLRGPGASGLVKFDLGSRALYAADASNYRQLPIGVVFPRDAADVEVALAACRATGAAVLPRGAGTSLAGQCVNVAVVFDYSRHMNALRGIDPAAKLAAVEPGIVLDRLREAAEQHQLTYAPDPATHSRCTLGGMLGNNSCGVHGLLGGKAVDNVESLDIVLYDGTRMTVGPTAPQELEAVIRAGGRRGEIYAGLKRLRDRYGDLVRQRFPRIPRRVSGYNLDELLPENNFNVARALVGSEGTCVNIVSATLNLTASPQHRILVVLGFSDPFLAADAVPLALEHKPIGLEGFDSLLVEFMRRKGLALRDLDRLPAGVGFLLFEVGANSPEEARARAEEVSRASQQWPAPPVAHICTAAEAASVWHVRESALGAMVFVPGEPDRYEGWEDSAVPPEKLGAFLRRTTALMAEYGYRSPLYGHYGQGCVHMRINFDFRSAAGLRNFREFLERAADVVVEFGGSFSGEHGDGQARSVLLPKMFGPELVEAFRQFKALWDPDNRMNPGKLSDAVRVYDPVENLRHAVSPGAPGLASETGETTDPDKPGTGVPGLASETGETTEPDNPGAPGPSHLGTRETTGPNNPGTDAPGLAPETGETTEPDNPGAPGPSHLGTRETTDPDNPGTGAPGLAFETGETTQPHKHFAFLHDNGSLERAAERCVGVGACRNTKGGVMCPSYRATGEEQHSTRGRAHLLWEMMAGALRHEGFRSEAVHEALDLCLSCKACKTECPVQVDMAQYKAEFLAQHYKGRLHPLRHYVFGFADRWARYGSIAPALTNAILAGPLSPLVKRVAGVAQERRLPRLARKSFQRGREIGASHLSRKGRAKDGEPNSVLLWPDTWNNYYYPGALAAAETVLTEAGFAVEVPRGHVCCGRPLYDFGFLGAARAYLARILRSMAPQIDAGLPFLFLEPSCASVFKDELREFFPRDERASRLSGQVWLLADWMAEHAPDFGAGRLNGAHILIHGHCHHKAVFGGPESEIALLRQAGAMVEPIQAGCCGMAGPFGFEAEKFEVSRTIANDGLLPAIAAAGPLTVIVTDGFSCREQIAQLGHREALHFAEVLARTCGCGH